FALNPAMPNLHRLYQRQHAAIVHATATPYRERSHFDGQDVLESGLTKPGAADTGWLNRALVALASGGRVDPQGSRAIGVGPVTPPVVRGQAPVMSWAPQQLLPASEDTQARLLDLYRHTDTKLAAALEARIQLAALGRAGGIADAAPNAAQLPPGIARVRAFFAEAAGTAARYLARTGRTARGRLGLCRLGHAYQRGCSCWSARQPAWCARWRAGGDRDQHGRRLARDGGSGRHRIRPHCPHQRHGRHGPRYRHGRAARWRRAQGRAGEAMLCGRGPMGTCGVCEGHHWARWR